MKYKEKESTKRKGTKYVGEEHDEEISENRIDESKTSSRRIRTNKEHEYIELNMKSHQISNLATPTPPDRKKSTNK